jgi:polysaccharide deacetylase family protein (PEP-CTERM system associated)
LIVGAGITFTLDLEDTRSTNDPVVRYVDATRAIFEFLAARDVQGTVFVVGELAAAHPELAKEAAAAGHEVGLHGWRHAPLDRMTPDEVRADLVRGKALLEDLTGNAVDGFRAPMFSLIAATRWVTELLGECGFTYSSSVLPVRNPLYGDPTSPARPFRWPNGLLELPCPVLARRGIGLPFLGGVYLRTLPTPAIRAALALAPPEQMLWTYCHPYDIDHEEPFWVRPEAGPAGSRLLWYNRSRMLAKLHDLLAGRAAPPLGQRAVDEFPPR